MLSDDWRSSLEKLKAAIPPPAQPKWSGPIDAALSAEYPEDFLALIATYGSGQFEEIPNRIGCVFELFNPLDPQSRKDVEQSYEILREYRETEGEKYLPAEVHPIVPGVRICGSNDSRDYYFWKTGGAPNDWTTVFYGDMQDFIEFEMPLVVFLQRLIFGEIHRSQLKFAGPDFNPADFQFVPSFR